MFSTRSLFVRLEGYIASRDCYFYFEFLEPSGGKRPVDAPKTNLDLLAFLPGEGRGRRTGAEPLPAVSARVCHLLAAAVC